MGMRYTFVREHDIDATSEILKLERQAKRRKMKVLAKDEVATWWGGGALPRSNLDHVVAAEHLSFKSFAGAEVSVRGWPKLGSIDEQRTWVTRYSDHALLFFEVQKEGG